MTVAPGKPTDHHRPDIVTVGAPSRDGRWMTVREIYVRFRQPRDTARSRTRPYRALDVVSRAVYGFCGSVLVWLLLPTRVTANQVSVGGAIVGVIGCALLATPYRVSSLLGVVLLQLFIVVDWADGTLSRVRNSSSTQGLLLDNLLGEFVGLLLFIAAGLHNALLLDDARYLHLGFTAALGALMLRYVYNSKVLIVLVREKDRVQEILANRATWSAPSAPPDRRSGPTWATWIGGWTDLLWVSRYFINLLCIAYVFDAVYLFTIFYGIAFPLLFVRRLWVELRSGFGAVYNWIATSRD